MPRAMGLFRKAGFAAIADPVDYRTEGGRSDWRPERQLCRTAWRCSTSPRTSGSALLAYRLSGRIDSFFPGP